MVNEIYIDLKEREIYKSWNSNSKRQVYIVYWFNVNYQPELYHAVVNLNLYMAICSDTLLDRYEERPSLGECFFFLMLIQYTVELSKIGPSEKPNI